MEDLKTITKSEIFKVDFCKSFCELSKRPKTNQLVVKFSCASFNYKNLSFGFRKTKLFSKIFIF